MKININTQVSIEKLDINVDECGTIFINESEIISVDKINEIGYFLTDSIPRGDKYPNGVIISLGDDRKLKHGQHNDYSLVFGEYSKYTFEEIFKMILTDCGTEDINNEYAEGFKKHLIAICDKLVSELS